jgi:hypothetical protein
LNRTLIPAIVIFVAWGAAAIPASAQTDVPSIRAVAGVIVVGRDTGIVVAGRTPPACAGAMLTAGLFVRDRAQPSLVTAYPGALATSIRAGSDGSFTGSVPAPATLSSGPTRVWPGVSGGCLSTPIVDESLGVEVALLDPARNPGNTSTILLSPAALGSVSNGPEKTTLGAFVGSVSVLANGQKCAEVSTDPGVTRGGDVSLRLGESGQPASCAADGSSLTFLNARGETLYVTMTLMPETTRLLDNFAISPSSTGQGSSAGRPVEPSAPSLGGQSEPSQNPQAPLTAIEVGLVGLVLFATIAGVQRRRVQAARRYLRKGA